MWLWGSILGMFAGASMHGWSGAFWGAMIGWLAGLWLSKQGASSTETLRANALEKRVMKAQEAIDELRKRLERLERLEGREPATSTTEKSAQEAAGGTTMALTPSPSPSPPPVETPLPVDLNISEPAAHARPVAAVVIPPAGRELSANLPQATAPAPPGAASPSSPATAPPPPRRVEVPATPAGPGLVERLLEGNIVAKLGVVILFFGVGFLLKFAYDRGMFPPQLRLFAVAAASAGMFVIGFRVLEKLRAYALVMMGGAMGLLYLDVFFALKTFGMIGAPLGFALFAGLGVATIFLAVKLDARAFAALGMIGAFLAPILASTGSGNHVLLFSYYLLLNLVILAASWFKSWRELNFIGFLFTFAIALIWGNSTYRPEHFATIEPFLIAFFLLYLAIPILFAQRQPPELKGIVDATLVFGMPMSAAMLQAALTRGMGDYALALSAFGASLVYSALAWALWRREKMRLLAEAHLALAIVFGTVAPYFAFEGYPTFAFWTLEGAAIFWMGCRQKSVLARAFALALQLVAACYFWWVTGELAFVPGDHAWWNDRVIGCVLIAVASLLTAWFIRRFAEVVTATEAAFEGWVIAWGGAWLLIGAVTGIWQQWPDDVTRLSALLIGILGASFAFEWLGAMLAWRLLRLTARAHLPLIAVVTFVWLGLMPDSHPIVGPGILAWPLSFAGYFAVLHRQRLDAIEAASGWRYALAWLLMILLASREAVWRYDQHEFAWVWAIGAAGLIAAGLRHHLRGKGRDNVRTSLSNLPLWWALVWWLAGLHGMIEVHSPHVHHVALHISAAAMSVGAFELAGARLAWTALRRTQVVLGVTMLIAAMDLAGHDLNPFHGALWLAWLPAFVACDAVLWRQERDRVALAPAIQHVYLFALALWLVGFELAWRADHAGLARAWHFAAAGATLATGLAIATYGIRRERWPFAAHAAAFKSGALLPLLLLGLLWTLAVNTTSDGNPAPLPYLPVLNPLDLAQLALLGAGVWALGTASDDPDTRQVLTLMFSVAAFLWLNAALLRTVHHWADVPFELHALLRSVVAQAALSLLWTATALAVMFAAVKRALRPCWMVGAALLGMVVLKLFVNDLGNTGTVARIVSFIGVGVLLLVIGYVAPVPPKHAPTGKT